MIVAVIDYGSGNLRSAAKALERAAGDATRVRITDDAAVVHDADHIVLPGVGAFADCMAGLGALPGMCAALESAVRRAGRPFLGICVGMQLMAERGFEYGVHDGLGWVAGEVRPLAPADPWLKIPHMGWNELEIARGDHPVLAGIGSGEHCYFVHSNQLVCRDADVVAATVTYGGPVTAIIARDNLVGTQFHPEKSQATGLRLLANFLAWRP